MLPNFWSTVTGVFGAAVADAVKPAPLSAITPRNTAITPRSSLVTESVFIQFLRLQRSSASSSCSRNRQVNQFRHWLFRLKMTANGVAHHFLELGSRLRLGEDAV